MQLGLVVLLAIMLLTTSGNSSRIVRAQDNEQLRQEVEQKNKEIQEIQEQIKETQKNLNEVESTKRTYKSEVSRLDGNIQQLDLGIRSAEISISKLNLEITALDYEVNIIEADIEDKNEAVAKVLREVQVKDSEGTLMTLLKSKNLSEGVDNVQNLLDLNNKLRAESQNLKNLRDELSEKRNEQTGKKDDKVLENQNFQYRKVIIQDQQAEKKKLLNLTEKQAQDYENKLDELRKRQEDIASEIEEIERKLKADFDPNKIPSKGPVLDIPLKVSLINTLSQEYGQTAFARFGYRGGFHNGIDLAVPVGTPVFASEDGEVVASGNQDNYCYRGAYGKFIAVKHSTTNLTTMYAHLSRYLVTAGDKVKRGDLIGYTGTTGYSTGPHLHYTVYLTPTFYMGPSVYCGPMPFGAHMDPMDYLRL